MGHLGDVLRSVRDRAEPQRAPDRPAPAALALIVHVVGAGTLLPVVRQGQH